MLEDVRGTPEVDGILVDKLEVEWSDVGGVWIVEVCEWCAEGDVMVVV